jgi:polyferredoxin
MEKRRIVQIASFLIHNGYLGVVTGSILYRGWLKGVCAPGLNCASCPFALFACPLGILQNFISFFRILPFSALISTFFYTSAFFLIYGLLFGRAICGWLCPFGFLQELLYKIPFYKKNFPRILRYIKYFFLIFFVILLPALITNELGYGEPWFCKYICPVGTLEAGYGMLLFQRKFVSLIGTVFYFKTFLLVLILTLCLIEERFFCKYLCPLGLIYGFFNKISFLRIKVKKSLCKNCKNCIGVCPQKIDPVEEADSTECIKCFKCKDVCSKKAIILKIEL